MKDVLTQFRRESENIRVTPMAHSWERVRARVDASKSRRRLFSARILSMAAVLLSLIAISAGLLMYAQWQNAVQKAQYSLSIQELTTTTQSGGIYSLENIRNFYQVLGQ